MSTVLLVTPESDYDALTLSGWASDLLRLEGGHSAPRHSITRIPGPNLSRSRLEEYFTAFAPPDAVIYFGHGNWDSLVGHEVLIDADNAHLVDGGIVVAIACRAAHTLGSVATTGEDPPIASFLGFNEEFRWTPGYEENFGTAVIKAMSSFLEGETCQRVAANLRDEFHSLWQYFKYEVPHEDPNDWDHQSCWLNAAWDEFQVQLYGEQLANLTPDDRSRTPVGPL